MIGMGSRVAQKLTGEAEYKDGEQGRWEKVEKKKKNYEIHEKVKSECLSECLVSPYSWDDEDAKKGSRAFGQTLLFALQGHEMRAAPSDQAAVGLQTNQLVRETCLLACFF
jgi:hypothetical protein